MISFFWNFASGRPLKEAKKGGVKNQQAIQNIS
jgi:hypothetical protein